MRAAWRQQNGGAGRINQIDNRRRAGHARRQRQAASMAAVLAVAAAAGIAQADVVWGDFETGTAPGFGALTNSGVQPWSAPVNGAVITAPSGPLAGSQVLELTGSANFNFGQSSGGALGFDFLSQNLRQAFFDNDQIEFDWYPTPNGSPSGFSQLYNIILNSQGGGFTNVDGYSAGNQNLNQYYFTGYNGVLHHVVIPYTAYKNAILASGNPNGGGWLQFGIQPNAGDGAPADYYFDNFKFSIAQTLWNVNADGNWSTGSNWSTNAEPNVAGRLVNFGPVITAPHTVTVDGAKTVGQITFNNANKYTVAGTETLTLDSTSSVGIIVSNGNHEIAAPLALAKDANIAVGAAGSTLTLSNLQASSVGVTKTGAGTLAVNYVRAASVNVQAGSLTVLQNGTASGVSNVATVTIGATAKLDLKDNKLITNTTAGTSSGGVYGGLQGEVQRAYDFNAWDQPGLTTSMPDAVAGLTTIGIATGEQMRGLGPTDTDTFAGQTITGASTIAMYTYAGDGNLDGVIDGGDYGIIDNFVQVPGADGYANGDFNYDGVIDGGDYGVIDNNIQAQGPGFSTSGSLGGVTTVPEPGSATLLLIAGLGAGAIRRRRRC